MLNIPRLIPRYIPRFIPRLNYLSKQNYNPIQLKLIKKLWLNLKDKCKQYTQYKTIIRLIQHSDPEQ